MLAVLPGCSTNSCDFFSFFFGFVGQDPHRPVFSTLVLPPSGPCRPKDENYGGVDRNLAQQLLLDDQLREQRWIGVVVPEPWCARCMQSFVKDIEIIVDG